ncbi:hypothetical protein JOC94_003699 [Bacillus thermophilus]|uniref:Uncharacterized protein n=1 Tax=Siminovitchia thermophila TaxID=1245522 RepID=A0ABS2RAI9_9BACI|nr:hypothetical protein [Siminovitchia thermophila]
MNKDAIWRANVVVKSEMSMILLNIVFLPWEEARDEPDL